MSSLVRTSLWLSAMLLIIAGCREHVQPTAFRASFLNDNDSLDSTLAILERFGCRQDSLSRFRRSVEHYYSSEFRFDLSKFPRPYDGVYGFASAEHFVSALPHRLWDTDHPFTMNCFDTAVLLAGDAMSTEMEIDRPGPILLPPVKPTQRPLANWAWRTSATPRAAFQALQPPWYTNDLRVTTGFVHSEDQMCRLASLHAFHLLPEDATESNVGDAVLAALRRRWASHGFSLPEHPEVVLLHNVDFDSRFFFTVHAGLLFKNGGSYTHVEKCGGHGPFLRLDFEKIDDLLLHYGGILSSTGPRGKYTHFIMTIGTTSVYDVPLQPVPLLTKDNKLIIGEDSSSSPDTGGSAPSNLSEDVQGTPKSVRSLVHTR